MIVQCTDCTTRYQLDPARVPEEQIRVRCPRCSYVFSIDGRRAAADSHEVAEQPTPAAAPAMEVETGYVAPADSTPRAYDDAPGSFDPPEQNFAPPEPTPVPETAPPVDEPAVAADFEPEPEFQPEPAPAMPAAASFDLEIEHASPQARQADAQAAPVAVAEEPATIQAPARPTAAPSADDKSRRLARALVSDILVYNRETRDRALAEGKLVQALGTEIKKSWELYKEKVTPEVANSNNTFREALNEILADGQKIF